MRFQYVRAILSLSWPILVAQLAVLANGVADVVMTGHYSATHLAAVGIGSAIYVTIWVVLMGVLQSLSPLIATRFGAGERAAVGVQARQGALVAIGLSVMGVALLSLSQPVLKWADVPANVAPIASGYLRAIAWGLPATLLARVFYALAPAVGRSRPVMVINLAMLFVKIPLTYVLLYGKLGLPQLGAVGCAVASAVEFWIMLACATLLLFFDPFYRQFEIFHGRLWPHWTMLKGILGLGIPIALTYLVDVSAFTFMALFLARLGARVLAGHQIISNLAVILFMIPLSIGIGAQVLIGHALGGSDLGRARQISLAGLRLGVSVALMASTLLLLLNVRVLRLYTDDPDVLAFAVTLLPLLAAYHLFDAAQCVAVNALRGYRHALVPTLIYVAALWGVGLGGGWWLAFRGLYLPPLGIVVAPQGAFGMWLAAALSLVIAAYGLIAYLLRVSRGRFQRNHIT
jgi:MATE family multidrug resistance protein